MKGKSLNNEPQETTETERVIEAISMLSNLDRMFLKEIKMESVKGLKMGRELERSYFSFEVVFAKQSQEARSKIPLFTMEAFAKSEAKRIKAILDKVESLSNPDYFANHNAYIAATGYISYLNSIVEDQPLTSKKEYYYEYAELLIELKDFITDISAHDFGFFLKNKSLPQGTKKGVWIGKRLDAWIFADYLSFAKKDFNKGFDIQKGSRPLQQSDKPTQILNDNKLVPILKKHIVSKVKDYK